MYLQDSDLNTIDPQELKNELINEKSRDMVSDEEAQNALASMYSEASLKTTHLYYSNPNDVNDAKSRSFSIGLAGGHLWEKLKKFLCEHINKENMSDSVIIDKVLEYLSSVIPGGIIIKPLLKIVINYILNLGYDKLCPVA